MPWSPEHVKKVILDNLRITIREVADDAGISFGSCQAIFTDVLGMKRAAAKIVPFQIAKFWAKTTSHGHRSGDVDDVQRRSRFVQKGHNWWRIMDVWLWHWNQRPIIPMETSRIAKIVQKSTSSSENSFLRLQWLSASWILATCSYGQ